MNVACVFAIAVLTSVCVGQISFHEDFSSLDKWTDSKNRTDYGKFGISFGRFFGNKDINQGAKTTQDARFYAISTEIQAVTNQDKEFVVSFSVKHEQGLDCGGGYIKLLPAMDATNFNGESEYFLMFGPDQCGSMRRVHLILHYKGKNHEWKKQPSYPDDKLTHVYTFRLKPDNTYEMQIDQEVKESGSLDADWGMLAPKKIDDPEDKKPADWVDDAEIDDPEDKKPADWDSEPEQISDPDAKKPDDWDDTEDGEYEVPMIPNPKHKGTWTPKTIPNPAYKGEWKAKQIANPEYDADDKLYLIRKPIKHVGIDVWQVKSGSIFDNIVIGDNLDEVNAIIDSTWKATKDAEKDAEKATTADEKSDEKEDPEKKEDSAEDDL
eukprot:Tbor_TRINITY_DN5777_c1_g1::TRINITY_DN5777_c1_g1_i1::g.20403::m.20403/K08057/CALR; calreticulin